MCEKNEARPVVTDFLDEFKDALFEQLIDDHRRWGDTWLKRTKEGQEDRTRKKFNDYFDQFENAGTSVPWLKIAGGALICWIRERHPELCPDIDVVEEAEILMRKYADEQQAKEDATNLNKIDGRNQD